MADFAIKQHDWGGFVDIPLEEWNYDTEAWQPIDLTDAASLRLLMKSDTAAVVAGSCVVLGAPTDGVARATFDVDDLTFAGDYHAEVEITWSGGAVETIPNGATDQKYLDFEVLEDLG